MLEEIDDCFEQIEVSSRYHNQPTTRYANNYKDRENVVAGMSLKAEERFKRAEAGHCHVKI